MPKKIQRETQRISTLVTFCLLLLLTSAMPALAAEPKGEPSAPNQPTTADDNVLEAGVWYVQTYSPCGNGNLSATRPDALGLRDKLRARDWFFNPFNLSVFRYPTPQWNVPLVWGNADAWATDWRNFANGGSEEYQMDTVDLAYFSGHGSQTSFYFGNPAHGCSVHRDQALNSWGTLDNDWVALSACNTLDDPSDSHRYWARAMNGTRLLLGFKTVMADVDFGVALGHQLRWNHSFTYAWFAAADQKLPGNQIARVLAEDNSYFYDRWNNHNSSTFIDSTYHWWTHNVGQNNLPPSALHAANANAADEYNTLLRVVDPAQINNEMPVFLVKPLSLDESGRQYNNLLNAFNITNTQAISGVVAASDVESLYTTNEVTTTANGDLIMDQKAGNFFYGDSNRLWTSQAVSQAVQAASSQAVMAIDADTAKVIAEQFLNQNGLMPTDAEFTQVVQDTITTGLDPTRFVADSVAAAAVPMQILDEQMSNHQVVYSRVISYTPTTLRAASPAETVDFSVVGPGAKLKVYVAASVPASLTASSLLAEGVLGGMGGYRQIEQGTVSAAGKSEVLTTSILALDTIKSVFNKIENKVALSYVPLVAKSREVISSTLSYWEGPIGFNQDQLIPVYVLRIKATLEDGSFQFYDAYIPVNQQYMAPYAKINAPANLSSALPGMTLTLTAADASKTLKELGVDDSLNFTLGTGNPDSYIYEWYKDEVAGTPIGTGKSLNFTVPSGGNSDKPVTVKLILVVRDSLSNREPNINTDEVELSFSQVFLPAALK